MYLPNRLFLFFRLYYYVKNKLILNDFMISIDLYSIDICRICILNKKKVVQGYSTQQQ